MLAIVGIAVFAFRFITAEFVVRHSQSKAVRLCPENTTTMWEGYSFMYAEGHQHSHYQDLGQPGSCLERFNMLPFLLCNDLYTCHYAMRGEKTYWLSAQTSKTNQPLKGRDIAEYISRCVVCDTPARIVVVHSQTLAIPQCPLDWSLMWIGYSFLMYSGAGSNGGGVSLSSPGSCLETFVTRAMIECNGAAASCFIYNDLYSFWLIAIDKAHMFDKLYPSHVIRTPEPFVSRCSVCQYTGN